ncbi:MAG: flagellar assembly protein FliW [Defluviitaleaceae bacterium]|nr:flagellar assembly protein FliW [Defluviitaleaceae bacterium]
MKITTQNFGEIEINQEDVINFNDGLPGFENARRFVVMEQEGEQGEKSPICFLQSLDDGELCFVLVDMTLFAPEYRPLVLVELAKEQPTSFDPDNTMVCNIATIYEDLAESTVNLKAPIIINIDQKIGWQFLCNDDFPIRAKLFAQTENKNGGCCCPGGGSC